MKVANIILDLKTKSVDRPFTYSIPDRFLNVCQIGERCYVDFNHMKRMGIIISIDDITDIFNLKEIDDLIDIEPVLTKELIDVGMYLSKTSCYPLITYLETMIPNVLKVSYSKTLKLIDKDDFKLNLIFNSKDEIEYDSLDKSDLETIKDALKNKKVELVLSYNRKESIKYIKYVKLLKESDKLTSKRKEVIDYLKRNNNECLWLDLRDDLNVSLDTLYRMEDIGLITIFEKEAYRDITTLKPLQDKRVEFTSEQEEVFNILKNNLSNNVTYLLHGITGSGKTEIYLNLIEEVIRNGKEAIILVPEISLTPMMVNRFKSRFGSDVAIFHSELSDNTRYDEWRKVLRGEVKIAVGARSAVFAPFKNLGIIIIDEEHESSYKQDNSPMYHARDVAERRCKLNNCMLLLGSATPSIESYARCLKDVYKLVELKKRANNFGLPETITVDLNEEFRKGMKGYISDTLKKEIEDRLEKGEQSLLLLNRRGYSSFVMCRACGHVEKCPNCDVSLTYHQFDNSLKCHYCGYEKPLITSCSKCNSPFLERMGMGTEKLEEELNKLFPRAKTVRMDNDTTRGKNGHEKVLYDFENNGDILLGTQMIAKGLDFPNVTLVGVINADQSLMIPDFRSKEETFELLTQVSGRAGRGNKPGKVIVQTHNKNHYAIKYGLLQDYNGFFNEEMKVRKIARFVPFYYMTQIKIKSKDMKECYNEAFKIKMSLIDKYREDELIVMGPIKPTISKIDSFYIFNIVIKYKVVKDLDETLKDIYDKESNNGVLISIDRFPSSF